MEFVRDWLKPNVRDPMVEDEEVAVEVEVAVLVIRGALNGFLSPWADSFK